MRRLGVLIACLLLAACSASSPSTTGASGSGAGSTETSATESGTESPTSSPSQTPTQPPPPDCAVLKCIALTFDDGPVPETTQPVIDALHDRHATATMFLVGSNVAKYPDLVRAEQQAGLEIGNHSWSHPQLKKLPDEKVRKELSDTQDAIAAVTGAKPTLMRPPYASRNARTDQICAELGLAVVVWDSSPADWETKSADVVVQKTLSQARPNSIVLMHDIHPWTAQAVPRIVDGLQADGYTLVTVTQLLGTVTPGTVYPA